MCAILHYFTKIIAHSNDVQPELICDVGISSQGHSDPSKAGIQFTICFMRPQAMAIHTRSFS